MENKWILNSGNSPKHPEFRLFCIPYSGGSASYYSGWNQLFGDNIEILPIQYPGHETRADEPLIPDVRALAEAALEGIVPDTDMPFGFFGHSLGALVAFETAALFTEYELDLPQMVFLSSAGTNFDRVQPPVHTLSGEALKKTIITFGGVTSKDVLYTEAFDTFYAPLLINDFSAAETYQIRSGSVIHTPVHVFYGTEDAYVTAEDVQKWKAHTDGGCSYDAFPGNHFYLNSQLETVCQKIKTMIEKDRNKVK